MTSRISRLCLALAVLVLVSFFGAPPSFAQEGKSVATGLNGPMGVLVDNGGNVWVVDTGVGGESEMQFPHPMTGAMTTVTYGNTARVVRLDGKGGQTEIATLPSVVVGPGEAFGGGQLAMIDGAVYVTSGTWRVEAGDEPLAAMASVMKIADGDVHEVVNAYGIEKTDNPDGFLVDSNPFGLAAAPDGMLWLTDSAGNTLCTVDPATGALELVTVFGGLASPLPNPNRNDAMEADPVPTGVAFGEDGRVYVALLSGFPFVPGSAKVVTVEDDGAVADFATNLTMLIDLEMGPDGELYAVSFGRFTEQGPQPASGSVVRIREGEASEVVIDNLTFPTSIGFSASGDAYVTVNGVGAPGSGEVMLFAGLASTK